MDYCKILKEYKVSRLRLDREWLNIAFLRSCKHLNVVPKFLRFKINNVNNWLGDTKQKLEHTCLNIDIRKKFVELDSCSSQTYKI